MLNTQPRFCYASLSLSMTGLKKGLPWKNGLAYLSFFVSGEEKGFVTLMAGVSRLFSFKSSPADYDWQVSKTSLCLELKSRPKVSVINIIRKYGCTLKVCQT
jgi:hypothetical protein